MKILFVVSGNVSTMPFVDEQKISLEKVGCDVFLFYIIGRGFLGYLKNFLRLRRVVASGGFDLVHAHYGLSGLLSVLQRQVPVVITFHGSDVYLPKNRLFSFLASRCSAHSIFVNESMPRMIFCRKNYSVIPCGVNEDIFYPMNSDAARDELGLVRNYKYVLFSSSFDNPIKNFSLAMDSMAFFQNDVFLLELKGRSRNEVRLLLNACNLLLMTSFSEGSPQIVKEALACGTPVVSTYVGDVPDLLRGVPGCYLVDFMPSEIADKVKVILSESEGRVRTNLLPEKYLCDQVACKILDVYRGVVNCDKA